MKLESTILIKKSPTDVWTYLSDVNNIGKWDRGVRRADAAPTAEPGIGYEFETFSDETGGGRVAYRIVQAEPDRGCIVRLTSSTGNARFFKWAQWHFHLKSTAGGSLLTCSAEFVLRLRYIILSPAFYFMKSAIHSDLIRLKKVLESD
jgi:uncharacterized protein YndB with AHSA1/START domain